MNELSQKLRDKKKPDCNIEWQDITEFRAKHYGDIEHRDTVRKGAYLWYEFDEAGWIRPPDLNSEDNELQLDSIESAKLDKKLEELRAERTKLQTMRVEKNRISRQDARFELYYENVGRFIQMFPSVENSHVRENRKFSELESVLSLADIHGGANFKTDYNTYNFNEMEKRFEILLDGTLDYIEDTGISTLKVVSLGDDIQGLIRVSDLKLNETTVVEATVRVARAISNFLNELSKYVYVEYYHTPSSNHSQVRPIGTKASELGAEDMEFVIGNYIKDVLANNQMVDVNLAFGKEYIEIPIHDFSAVAMHGHQLKNPLKDISKLSFKHRRFWDFLFCAHYHASNEAVAMESDGSHDIEVLVCPAFVGTCPFADKIFVGAKPACKIFSFDKKYGLKRTDKIVLVD